ncbi:hypothetical protein M8494_08080 [Serratia ureilytica]
MIRSIAILTPVSCSTASRLNAELAKRETGRHQQPEDFRNEIELRAAPRANNNGRNPNWTSYEKLRTVIEKKMFSCTEELLPVISFNAKTSTDEQKKNTTTSSTA